jgi:hypothetical protein
MTSPAVRPARTVFPGYQGHRGTAAAGLGAGLWGPPGLPGPVLEAEVRFGRRRQPRTFTQVTSCQAAIAGSSRWAARCAGTSGANSIQCSG